MYIYTKYFTIFTTLILSLVFIKYIIDNYNYLLHLYCIYKFTFKRMYRCAYLLITFYSSKTYGADEHCALHTHHLVSLCALVIISWTIQVSTDGKFTKTNTHF